MAKRQESISVNPMDNEFVHGIAIDRILIEQADFKASNYYAQATQPHRDEGHTFHIVENGSVFIEIDFQKYQIDAPAVVYMHPNQVHRILEFSSMNVCSLAITSENLNPEYCSFLERLVPLKPLQLTRDFSAKISELFAICLNFLRAKKDVLHHLVLKDSCNTLVGFIISAFLSQAGPPAKLSRTELISKRFQQLLEISYLTNKRPNEYAKLLHISTHYLNENVKNTTGLSVSQHIQNRVILEAKRLLYHTDKSVKEIAFELGYDDYPYFSRIFTKAVGLSALAFRSKRHE
ncbi:helix-turn-helix domain-containing protein [Sphingobacterium multivorum]|uniref:Helix-turn-helix transcriptional regulator n=1 Tax=Sphingobacterium thalpophilum TaxID=259 RepID=A0ACD5C2P3_9SPHI